jgi:ornithine cyclodeaminase/alanine dehydrogenase-like protein (mu-crystallin family)
VWSRNAEARARFAEQYNATAADSAEAAVRGADIVATATNAKEPVLEDSWIQPGVHINAMGSNMANRRELPAQLVQRADLVVVDSREQAEVEAGDLILADRWSNVVELAHVAQGFDASKITIFKSIGLGIEDVAAGGYVYEQALAKKVGRPLYS